MSTFDESELPRFLRSRALLHQLKVADERYLENATTGPLLFEIHYQAGSPNRIKLKSESTMNAPTGRE